MLFPVELERSAGRQRPQDTPTSSFFSAASPPTLFPLLCWVLRFALLAALRLSPISTRLVLAWLPLPTDSTGFKRPTSAETWPRACVRILRTRSPEPPGPIEFRLPMPALLLLLLLAAAPAPARAGDPYAYYDWEVSYISAQPLGVKQKVPPVPPLSLPCIPATAASTLT
jgi:hypothetical protein